MSNFIDEQQQHLSNNNNSTRFSPQTKQEAPPRSGKYHEVPHSKEKFATTFENTVTLVNGSEITVTDGKAPALEPRETGMVMSMQFSVTGDIDDEDEVVSQGFLKKLLQGPKQLMGN
ncbi:hypothetical protein SI65_07244 [Aspergillus cristatus]|uniref:Uncharacterized protein n=1 Tax=Aspergillus cristatus TaxID=573508 RepID=A0A1E3B9G7_ASPCR|nr:hypothetical protein SI65_07244 [Aspergillus cristatus]